MSYKLEFHAKALKEWNKLDNAIKQQFKKKLKERIKSPKVAKDKLKGYQKVYKIKLRSAGYRLAYQVIDDKLIIYIIVIGKRENNEIYQSLNQRKN